MRILTYDVEFGLACDHSTIILSYTDVLCIILWAQMIDDEFGDIPLWNNHCSVVGDDLHLILVPCDLWLWFPCYNYFQSAMKFHSIY